MILVKCQRSQFTTESGRQMLFYDRTNDHFWEGELTPYWSQLFDKHGERFFASVDWNDVRPPMLRQVLPGDFDF